MPPKPAEPFTSSPKLYGLLHIGKSLSTKLPNLQSSRTHVRNSELQRRRPGLRIFACTIIDKHLITSRKTLHAHRAHHMNQMRKSPCFNTENHKLLPQASPGEVPAATAHLIPHLVRLPPHLHMESSPSLSYKESQTPLPPEKRHGQWPHGFSRDNLPAPLKRHCRANTNSALASVSQRGPFAGLSPERPVPTKEGRFRDSADPGKSDTAPFWQRQFTCLHLTKADTCVARAQIFGSRNPLADTHE